MTRAVIKIEYWRSTCSLSVLNLGHKNVLRQL